MMGRERIRPQTEVQRRRVSARLTSNALGQNIDEETFNMSDVPAPPPPPENNPPPPPEPPPMAPPPPSATPPSGGGNVSENRSIMIVLSYLWVLAPIPYLLEKDDAEVQWHAKNGLVLLAAEILISIPLFLVGFIPCLGCLLAIIPLLLWIPIIGLHIYCIVKGLDGQRVEIPYLSDLTQHL